MKDEFPPPPVLTRTLSEQHWFNATDILLSSDRDEMCAGKQGTWEFRLKKLPGSKVERITLLNDNVIHREVKDAV